MRQFANLGTFPDLGNSGATYDGTLIYTNKTTCYQ